MMAAQQVGDGLSAFLEPYHDLFRDRRLVAGFDAALAGILASGGTRLSQMARTAPTLGGTPHAERRLRRLIHHQHQRSDLTPEALTLRMQQQAALRLAHTPEVVIVMDGCDLRKPHSQRLEYLDTVRDLKGQPVSGYHTLNAIALTPDGRQTLVYHTTYSVRAPGFLSENVIVHQALTQITQNLRGAGVSRLIFVLDRGFDDLKLIRHLRSLRVDFVIRARALDRLVQRTIDGPIQHLHEVWATSPVAHQFEMSRPVERLGKVAWKPTRTEVRTQDLWLSRGTVPIHAVQLAFPTRPADTASGWVLLTSLSVSPGVDAGQVIRLYLRRWSIEEVFAWTKTALGWEQVQVLDFEAIRTLVAMAWIAAAYVFTLGEQLDAPAVRLLAQLGGYVPHKHRPPGKKTLLLGVQRLAAAYLAHTLFRQPHQHPSLETVLHSVFGTP